MRGFGLPPLYLGLAMMTKFDGAAQYGVSAPKVLESLLACQRELSNFRSVVKLC